MNANDPQSHRFGHELHKKDYAILEKQQIQHLLEKLANKELVDQERSDAFESLFKAHARLIYGQLKKRLTGYGTVGTEDRVTDFFNDFVVELDMELTKLARASVTQGFTFASAVKYRVGKRFLNKIEHANRQKRDQRRTQQMEEVEFVSQENETELQLLLGEVEQQARLLLNEAIQDDLERDIILATYGLGDGHAMTIRDAAESLGIDVSSARNAYKRAMYRLKNLIPEN